VDLAVLVNTLLAGAEELLGLPVVDLQDESTTRDSRTQLPLVLPDALVVEVLLGDFPQLAHVTPHICFVDRSIGKDEDLRGVELERAPFSNQVINACCTCRRSKANTNCTVQTLASELATDPPILRDLRNDLVRLLDRNWS